MSDPTPYTVGLQPQFTQLQPQFTQIQPQFTSFNPYQQQAEQEAAQAEYLRQQQMFMLQQQQAAQQQAQQEEWMQQQLLIQQQQQLAQQQQQQQQSLFAQQPLVAQPTGFGYVIFSDFSCVLLMQVASSNNPFAKTQASSPPPMPTIQQPPSFNLQGTYENQYNGGYNQPQSQSPISASPSPGPTNKPMQVKTRQNENQQLATLFANRDDGQDTFGNVGALRCVLGLVSVTTFFLTRFHRYGHGAGRALGVQPIGTSPGHNPFAQQQQPQQQNSEQPFFSI